uniref:Semaphorin 4D n=1 Tax=Cyprinus carpio carpio TaxID=630221 RepID=A0A8C1FP39_CYPCA
MSRCDNLLSDVTCSVCVCVDVDLLEFWEPDVFNYTTLLLSEERGVLYVGAREAVYQLNMSNVSIKSNQLLWKVPERDMSMCILKGKSKETDCRNYIRVLQVLDEDTLYVCGTHAFQPLCDYLSLQGFRLQDRAEDGRGKCSFDPAQSFTSVMVDGELYSGTAYNFLGSEPIISRSSLSQSLLRTEYSTSWLNEPSFVFTDVIREGQNSPDGDDDKIYYFFTEVSVEYEFFGKLLIPRIARVCKGDLGGQRTLQKKWTSFLKAKLVCSMPELNFVFNVVHDVFILKAPHWRDTVIYGVFTSQWGNVGLSAVCAYNMSSVHEVFSKGKYMQKVTVEQSHTKWVRFNGITPSPRPGECINNLNRMQNITSSLQLPDKTLQFVKDHPLLEDPVLPIGNGPRLVTKDVNYTQIAVQRVQALDGSIHHVIFTGTDKGLLHKSLVLEGEVHIVEEIQLLKNTEPIKTLLLSSQARFLYAGSDSGVVQSPTAFCEKYPSCVDCVLARDPYCAWDPRSGSCLNIFQHDADPR